MKNCKIILTFVIFLIINNLSYAQGPPKPPGDPNLGGGPVGGSAPVGSGIAIMLSLGAAYGGQKIYRYWQSQKEELED